MDNAQLSGLKALPREVEAEVHAVAGVFRDARGAVGLLFGLCLLAASLAAATPEYVLPTLFDVTGVAADDLLHSRAAPSISAAIVGSLSPRALTGAVEVEVEGKIEWAEGMVRKAFGKAKDALREG